MGTQMAYEHIWYGVLNGIRSPYSMEPKWHGVPNGMRSNIGCGHKWHGVPYIVGPNMAKDPILFGARLVWIHIRLN